MMPLIDSKTAALDLARALLVDARLDEDRSTTRLEEARTLFQFRVTAALHPLFDTVLTKSEVPSIALVGQAEPRNQTMENVQIAINGQTNESGQLAQPALREPLATRATKRTKPLLAAILVMTLGLIGLLIWCASCAYR